MEKLSKVIPKNMMAFIGIASALSPSQQSMIRNVVEQQEKEEREKIEAKLYKLSIKEYRLVKSAGLLHLIK